MLCFVNRLYIISQQMCGTNQENNKAGGRDTRMIAGDSSTQTNESIIVRASKYTRCDRCRDRNRESLLTHSNASTAANNRVVHSVQLEDVYTLVLPHHFTNEDVDAAVAVLILYMHTAHRMHAHHICSTCVSPHVAVHV